jgi:hypothetical protein
LWIGQVCEILAAAGNALLEMDMSKQRPNYDFCAYAVGLCYASVCTSLSLEEATQRLNAEHPTGLEHGWKLAAEAFRTGERNPCPCPDYAEHWHFLFSC